MNTFSIILPVYNGEAFIEETLVSILKNIKSDDELLIVNDGSSDATATICEKYVSSNVHLYTKANEGVSIARNYGIKHATKDYILFIDADDMMCEGVMDKLHAQDFHNCDFIVGKTMIHFDSDTKEERVYNNLKDFKLTAKEDTITEFISAEDNLGIWAVWRHIFRRAFLINEELEFDSSYTYAEDMDFIMEALLKTKNFGIIDMPLIKYRQYASSVSGEYSLKSMKSHVSVLFKWQKNFHNSDFHPLNKKRIIRKLANKQIAMLAHVGHLSNDDKQVFFEMFNLSKEYLKYSSGKFKYVYHMGKLLGFRNVSKIVGKKK